MEPDGRIELTEEEYNDPGMVQMRASALEMAFGEGIIRSSPATTTMHAPRYMAKYEGLPLKYEWLCRIETTKGYLDSEGVYPSGLFKFTVVMDEEKKMPGRIDIEQIFI